jgi:hypothetical protein
MSPANRRLIEIAPSGHQPLDSTDAQYQDVGAPARADPNMWDTVGDRVLGVAGPARLEPSFRDEGPSAAPDISAEGNQQ